MTCFNFSLRHVISGNYTIKEDVGNENTVHVSGFNFQGGQYKLMVEKSLGQFCDIFYAEPHREVYESFSDYYTPNVEFGTCPFPANNYSMRDYLISNEKFEKLIPPYIPGSEKWKIVFKVLLDGKVRGGNVFYVTIRHEDRMTVLSG